MNRLNKVLFSLVLLFSLTGCKEKKPVITETPGPVIVQGNNQSDVPPEEPIDDPTEDPVGEPEYLYSEDTATQFDGVVLDKAANGNWYVEVIDAHDSLFVYQEPLIAEDYSKKFKAEANFYNPTGATVRAYELAKGDVIEISANGFSGVVAKGATVTGITSKKLTIA